MNHILDLRLLDIDVAHEKVSPCQLIFILLLLGQGLRLLREFPLFMFLGPIFDVPLRLESPTVLDVDLRELGAVVLLHLEVGHPGDLRVHSH